MCEHAAVGRDEVLALGADQPALGQAGAASDSTSDPDREQQTHDADCTRRLWSGGMILAALLLPVAVVAIVLLIQRLRVPAFLALMAVVVGYGIAAQHDLPVDRQGVRPGLRRGARAGGPAGRGRRAGRAPADQAAAARRRRRRRRRAGRARRLGRGRPRTAAAGGPRRRPRAHAARRPCAGGALAARGRRGVGAEGRSRDHGLRSPCPAAIVAARWSAGCCSRATTRARRACRSAGWRSRSRSRC